MTEISSIPSWIPSLIGVVLGFLLAEASRHIQYYWNIRRNRQIILTELQTILSQLVQKKDIILQAICNLKKGHLLPTRSVRTITTGYYSVLNDTYPHLSLVQRNCLHVIYERLRVMDEQMDGFEDAFTNVVKDDTFDNFSKMYIGQFEDIIDSCDVVICLAKKYIGGKPVDVFPMDSQ